MESSDARPPSTVAGLPAAIVVHGHPTWYIEVNSRTRKRGHTVAQKTIYVDDLTDAEIPEAGTIIVEAKLVIINPIAGKDEQPAEYQAKWEVTADTAESLRLLVEHGDLPTFLARMRPTLRVAAADTEVIRAWAREHHPELNVPERGRLGAWLIAMYRRETSAKPERDGKAEE